MRCTQIIESGHNILPISQSYPRSTILTLSVHYDLVKYRYVAEFRLAFHARQQRTSGRTWSSLAPPQVTDEVTIEDIATVDEMAGRK